MTVQFKLFRDESSALRAEFDEPYRVIGWYLEQDAPRVPARVDEVIARCDDIAQGRIAEWVTCGNAHELTVHGAMVSIETMYAEPPERSEVSLAEFKEVLARWKELLVATG
jgi:hypothetical protein